MQSFVILNDKKHNVDGKILSLSGQEIKSIKDIKNLDKLTNLEELNLQNNLITKIEGLEKLVNLKILYLNSNQISSIEGLECLKNLKILNLTANNLSVIQGLNHLTDLTTLHLWDNHIIEIKNLDQLTLLEYLFLSNNKIIEIKGLDNLTALKQLDLGQNPIKHLKGLESLRNLEKLGLEKTSINSEIIKKLGGFDKLYPHWVAYPKNFIKYCKGYYVEFKDDFIFTYGLEENELYLGNLDIKDIKEVERLDKLKHLKTLYLFNNVISKINGLENLECLKILDLQKNKISEISGLENLTSLKRLNLSNNYISIIKGLDCLKNLKELNLSGNLIKKINKLDLLSNLKILAIDNCQINEMCGLENLKNLEELSLWGNKDISEIKGINSLKNLKDLRLYKTNIVEIKGLENLQNLELLMLNNNKIRELKGLTNLTKLLSLNLNNNKIEEIKGLGDLSLLTHLYLYGNNIYEIKGLEKLNNLKRLSLAENAIPLDQINILGSFNEHGENLNPKLYVAYCILQPIINKITGQIKYSELINKYPILQKISIEELKELIKLFKYTLIRINDEKRVHSIVTPEFLTNILDELMKRLPPAQGYEKDFITTKLNLISEAETRKFISHVIDNELNKVPIFETKNFVKRAEFPKSNYQIIIFDTLNQRYFLNRNTFSYRLKQVDTLIYSNKPSNIKILKFAFINDEVLKSFSNALSYLDQNNWRFIYILKDKPPDYDSRLLNFIGELLDILNTEWNQIYVISSDSDIVNPILNSYGDPNSTKITFITAPNDLSLNSNNQLIRYSDNNFDINIFHKKMLL